MSQKSYYVAGNTADGFVNYLSSNLEGIDKVYILKHKSNTLKTSLFRSLLDFYKANTQIEVILSSLGKDYLDGVIIRDRSLAIINDRLQTDQLEKGAVIDLTKQVESFVNYNMEGGANESNIRKFTQLAYEEFEKGLSIHDELESVYIKEMNFKRADDLAEELIRELFAGIPRKNEKSFTFHRLFGTNTPEGAVNIVPELISSIENVYFIKGRAGTGKSTFMKKILTTFEMYGFDIELYHCSFDPESIDMVLVPELNFCIFDSTSPHEFFPKKNTHKTIDMYKETVTSGTDEKYLDKINSVTVKYKRHMKQGIDHLKTANLYLNKVENQYILNKSDMIRVIEYVINEINLKKNE